MTVPVITTVEPDPKKPALAVQLQARPPVVGKTYSDKDQHAEWTLDLLERTLFEFRAAGAWDQAVVHVENGYHGGGPVKCEVMAQLGEQAMPWGWRPSQGPPPPPARPALLPDPVVPDHDGWSLAELLGNRVLHGVLLLVLVAMSLRGAVL